jgi:hypothetical protein
MRFISMVIRYKRDDYKGDNYKGDNYKGDEKRITEEENHRPK